MKAKLKKLREILSSYERVALAYSGGVDSSFLLHFVGDVLGRENVLPITLFSEVTTEDELAFGQRLAQGFDHRVIEMSVLEIPEFVANSAERCYFCKMEIFKNIIAEARSNGFDKVVEGSNYSDLGDYRPGMVAVRELGVASPLLEAGLTKDEIREVSKAMGLETWDYPSKACSASRIPYGGEISLEKLQAVQACEGFLEEIGFSNLRVRHHGPVARIELEPSQMERALEKREEILSFFASYFTYISLDLRGFMSGSLNEVLDERV